MRKIPTLFKKVYDGKKCLGVSHEVTEGMEWVLEGKGNATVKYDGSCCAVINGKFYKRFDAKPGRKIPDGAIPCCEPDSVTGHHPHWVPVDMEGNADKWFVSAYAFRAMFDGVLEDGTYEAVGKHFNGNPYHMDADALLYHGVEVVEVERSYEGLKKYLEENYIEGLVFWKDGEPQCKIRRKDFKLPWNVRN